MNELEDQHSAGIRSEKIALRVLEILFVILILAFWFFGLEEWNSLLLFLLAWYFFEVLDLRDLKIQHQIERLEEEVRALK